MIRASCERIQDGNELISVEGSGQFRKFLIREDALTKVEPRGFDALIKQKADVEMAEAGDGAQADYDFCQPPGT